MSMQKKNRSIPKSLLIVRTLIIVLISNILLISLLPINSNIHIVDSQEIGPNKNEDYFIITALLKTKFKKGKEVSIIDNKNNEIKVKLVEEIISDTNEKQYLVIVNVEKISKLNQMKEAQILPIGTKVNILKKRKVNSYEIAY